MPTGRRALWGRFALGIAGPILFFLLLELALIATGRFEPVRYLRKIDNGGRAFWVTDSRFGELMMNRANMPAPKRIWVPVEKEPGTLRVVLLGESAAAGYPVPDYDLGRLVEILWNARFPEKPLEVVNLSMTGVNSHILRVVAREAMQLDPDALVIYAGHNEVIGPYGPVSVFGRQMPGNWLVQLSLAARNTRSGQALAKLLSSAECAGEAPPWEGLDEFKSANIAQNDPALQRMYGQVGGNLEAMVTGATGQGTKVVICVPAVNLNDWTPLASSEDSPADRHYGEGRRAEAEGKREEAWGHYRAAVDADMVRFRADSRVRQLQRDLAHELQNEGVSLVDADRWLHELNPGFETDRRFFLEHVHLTFEGRVAVAALIVDGLASSLVGLPLPREDDAPGWWESFSDTLDVARKRTLFTGVDDAAMWYTIQRLLAMKVFAGAPDMAQRREELAELEYSKRQEFLAEWDLERVRDAYGRAAQVNDNDPALHSTAGRLFQLGGDPAAAKDAFGKTLEKMPNRTESALALASLMIAEKQFEEAERILQEQENFDARVPDVAGLRATMLLMQQKPQEAVAYLERHLQQRPLDVSARRNLGSAFLERGDTEKAVRHFRRVVELQQDDAYVLNNLAWLLADSSAASPAELSDAVDFSRRAVDLEPKVHRYRGTLAYALLRNGQRDEAIQTAQEALEAARAAGDEDAAEMLREKVLREIDGAEG